MDIDSLVGALQLGDITKLLAPLATDDAAMTRDYVSVAAAKAGLDDDAQAVALDAITQLVTGLADEFGGGSGAVSAALTGIRPLTYGQLAGFAAAEINASLLHDGAVASQATDADHDSYVAAGDDWGLPDENVYDDPSHVGPADDTVDAEMRALAGTITLPDWCTIPQTLLDYADKLEDLWAKLPDAVDLDRQDRAGLGGLIHQHIQTQYLADHLGQDVMVDNRVSTGKPLAGPIGLSGFRAFLKALPRLSQMNSIPPMATFSTVRTALSQGFKTAAKFLRPDILNRCTKEVYEIKPVGQIAAGLRQLYKYLVVLNIAELGDSDDARSSIAQFLNNWTPGVGFNGIPYRPGLFWSPGITWTPPIPIRALPPSPDGKLYFYITALACPGLILYQVFEVDTEEALKRVKAATVAFTNALLMRRLLQKVAKKSADEAADAVAAALKLSDADALRLKVFCETIALAVVAGALMLSIETLVAL